MPSNPHFLSWRRLGRAALCALTLISLAVGLLPETSSASSPILSGAALWALALGGLWLLYGAWLRLERPLTPVRLWVLAALFAGVVTLGRSFAAVGTAELVTSHRLKALLAFAGQVPLYMAVMRLFSNALDLRGPLERKAPRTVVSSGILLLCWLPYWLAIFPGTVSNDSITQIQELFGVVLMSNGNPVFQTWLIDLFCRIGLWLGGADAAVALYCGVQAALMAWLLGSLTSEMARSDAPGWLAWGSLAFYALCPVFPTFAFCMGKDTNFAMAVLLLSLSAWRFLRGAEGSRSRARDAACLSLAAVLCALLRNAGVYLAALTLVMLLCRSLRKPVRGRGAWLAPSLGLLATLSVFGVLRLLILPGLDIRPMPETENYSLPLQQVARVAASHPLAPEEAAAIDGVLELDRLADAYNGELSDPVKLLWRGDATAEEKTAFWRTWLSLLGKHPATCLSATFHNTYGYLYPGYMSVIKPTLLLGDQSTRTASAKGLFDYSVNPRAETLKALHARLAENPLYRALLSPGLYGWLTLFAAALLLGRGRRRALPAAMPALFTLAGCLLSAVNGYFRYAMPLYLCAPLLLWLLTMRNCEGSVRP